MIPGRKRLQKRALHLPIISAYSLPLLAQQSTPEKAAPNRQQGGMSTGPAHAAVKDAASRPITAGGFVDGAPVIFVDATHAAGLDVFRHKSGGPEKRTILETPGSGVALLDY